MRKIATFVPLMALLGCSAVASAGPAETRSFPASRFDAVRVAGTDTVNIVRGTAIGILARGPKAQLDLLDIRTEGGTLIVARKPSTGIRWSSGNDVVVTVTMPTVRAVEVAGSSDVSVDRADGPQFEATVSGSGNLRLADVRAGRTRFRVRGSGDLEARGNTGVLASEISGSGNLDAHNLSADTVALAVRGSGNARAAARTSATIAVSGSGTGEVSGTRNCAITKSGSGEARCNG